MAPPVPIDNLQSALLEQVRKLLPSNISLADELSELLNISRDSAYRRIRGETVLSLDEAKKLYDRFGVSIDALFSQDSTMALFHHRALSLEYPLDQWLKSVARNLETMENMEAGTKQMIFAAKDIPIFHYFRLPEMSAFKMFFWLKSIIKDPKYAQKLFDDHAISSELMSTGKSVWKAYSNIPGVEIWTEEAVNDTLKQIGYFYECGYFSAKSQATLLCDQLLQINNMIREEAAEGKKSTGVDFQLYENEILIADNTVLAKLGDKRSVHINYNSLNLLTTFQESFCERTEVYLNNLIKNSILISATAARERNKFFNKMNERVEGFKKGLI
ncbi:MAG TPA: helix-turn-helix transcriptional regulator [Cyclobacteriaceae bacterium]|nr:helix-turn-helix transcriptional regulator [Cyclobacteriaceae bacterium]